MQCLRRSGEELLDEDREEVGLLPAGGRGSGVRVEVRRRSARSPQPVEQQRLQRRQALREGLALGIDQLAGHLQAGAVVQELAISPAIRKRRQGFEVFTGRSGRAACSGIIGRNVPARMHTNYLTVQPLAGTDVQE